MYVWNIPIILCVGRTTNDAVGHRRFVGHTSLGIRMADIVIKTEFLYKQAEGSKLF